MQLLQTHAHSSVPPLPTLLTRVFVTPRPHLVPYLTGSAHLVTLRISGGGSERRRME